MERITGPVGGYYLVSYACAVGELGREFMGYTRLCSKRPRSFWEARGPVTYGDTRFVDATLAMSNSEAIVLRRLTASTPAAGARPAAA